MINKKDYKVIGPFKGWVLQNFPFIEADFDAITSYQLWCKVVEYLNKVIYNEALLEEQSDELVDAFNNLKTYVDNYFNNLDLQDEVDNKLDEMVEDGTLQEIITDYLNSKAIFAFDNVASMKSSVNLINGSYAKTLGYYAKNDGGSGLYKIRELNENETADEMLLISINESLVAELIYETKLNILQLGAKNDNTLDCSSQLNLAINTVKNIFIPSGNYKISENIILKDNIFIYGEEGSSLLIDSTHQFILNANENNNYNLNLKKLVFRFNGERNTYGMHLKDLVYSTIEEVTFRSDNGTSKYNGLCLERVSANCYDNHITNCFFQRSNLVLINSTDNFILNNRIWSNNMTCYAIEMIDNCGNTLIEGNHIISSTGNGTGGIRSSGTQKILMRIINNYFDGGNFGICGTTYLNCSISNNTFFNTRKPIEIQQLFSSSVTSNLFYVKDRSIDWVDFNITYDHYGNTISNNSHYRENTTGTPTAPYNFAQQSSVMTLSIISNTSLAFTGEFGNVSTTTKCKYINCFPVEKFPSGE